MPRNPNYAPPVPDGAVYITSKQVCHRYGGRSIVWLRQKLRDDPEFPRPITISDGGWWFFKISDLEKYERKRAAMA